jgi:hypothetical protein
MNQKVENALSDFRGHLFRTRSSILALKGSCLRLKTKARNIATLLLEVTEQNEFPIDLNPICKEMHIHTIQRDDGSPFVSELCPDPKGFVIRIQDQLGGVRLRAALAHEIGHTLFYDTTQFPPVQIFRSTHSHSKADKQEWISWDFARELILPQKLIEQILLHQIYPSVSELMSISKRCEVSIDMLLHRIIRDLSIWQNCTMFICDIDSTRDKIGQTRVYRGRRFPKFRLMGSNGLLNSKEFQTFVQQLNQTQKLEQGLQFEGYDIWVSLNKYGARHTRVVGVLEIPALSDE